MIWAKFDLICEKALYNWWATDRPYTIPSTKIGRLTGQPPSESCLPAISTSNRSSEMPWISSSMYAMFHKDSRFFESSSQRQILHLHQRSILHPYPLKQRHLLYQCLSHRATRKFKEETDPSQRHSDRPPELWELPALLQRNRLR